MANATLKVETVRKAEITLTLTETEARAVTAMMYLASRYAAEFVSEFNYRCGCSPEQRLVSESDAIELTESIKSTLYRAVQNDNTVSL